MILYVYMIVDYWYDCLFVECYVWTLSFKRGRGVMSCYSFVYLFVMFYYVIKNTCLSV